MFVARNRAEVLAAYVRGGDFSQPAPSEKVYRAQRDEAHLAAIRKARAAAEAERHD